MLFKLALLFIFIWNFLLILLFFIFFNLVSLLFILSSVLLKLRNDVLTKKLSEKRKLLKEIKKMCSDQKKRIDELKKKITDNILKQNNENSKINFDDKHQIKNINNNNTPKALIDQIETINFDLYNTTLFQCGICMDSFNENEKIKKLHCDHIFHIDCMSQWLQTKKTCPFCDQAIFY